VLQIPVMGLEETMLYPTIWLNIFGAIKASRENTHTHANVLEIFISSKRAHHNSDHRRRGYQPDCRPVDFAFGLGIQPICLARLAENPTLYIPTIYSDVALLVGVTLMMVYTVWHLIQHILTLRNGTVA
jgi:TRAP-type C4-dicarboxylate transport system permease small subunit